MVGDKNVDDKIIGRVQVGEQVRDVDEEPEIEPVFATEAVISVKVSSRLDEAIRNTKQEIENGDTHDG